MRAAYVLLAAILLGLAGGYGWSALHPARPAVHIPKGVTPPQVELPQSDSDRQWAARALDGDNPAIDPSRDDPTVVERSVTYAGCNEVRAAGKAPLHAGEPGYRSDMDGDGDGIACEPIRPR